MPSGPLNLQPEEVSLAIGRGGMNIKLASMLTEYTIDVFREVDENEADEDIYLDEFSDEIDQWVIDAIKVGLGTDFDGDGGIRGLADSSELINFTLQLLRRKYSEQDIVKIWGGNWLRVMTQVQNFGK